MDLLLRFGDGLAGQDRNLVLYHHRTGIDFRHHPVHHHPGVLDLATEERIVGPNDGVGPGKAPGSAGWRLTPRKGNRSREPGPRISIHPARTTRSGE
jgi:hypothetical protein